MDVGGGVIGDFQVVEDAFCVKMQALFQQFLEEYRDETATRHSAFDDESSTNANVDPAFIYRIQVRVLEGDHSQVTVQFNHIEDYSQPLAQGIFEHYYRLYPYLCRAVKNFAKDHCSPTKTKDIHWERKEVFVAIENVKTHYQVRSLTADRIGRLLRISGQVVRTHPVHPELVRGVFKCNECNSQINNVEQQFKYTQPTKCVNPHCQNRTRFTLDVHKSIFIDFQKVRVQEVQSELPRGSIPRSVEVILRSECVEQCQPGDRCDFTGTLIVVPDVSQIAVPGQKHTESDKHHRGRRGYDNEGMQGLKSLGVRELTHRMAFLACSIEETSQRLGGHAAHDKQLTKEQLMRAAPEDMKRFLEMSQDKNLRKNLVSSLFPTIYGSDEIKHGVLLMLFGGVKKRTAEGTTLRGDINVCVVGDPSTAKSQVLKQVEEFSLRAVYTSGRASSAAGLTAAVVKDEESSEFVIEAGALMLADNGICCIDEFDKMDPKDQVAIHEAMEQQTISITKAGVKATLNARSSILAAANPIGGRYDRSKSLRQNINLTAPILSRFDLFFILIDECNEVTDYSIARKIVDLHRMQAEAATRVYGVHDVRRYIEWAKYFSPQLSEPAQERLVELYKRLRLRDRSGAAQSSWRITVRQLESLIRLSEATARMYCVDEITREHVDAAYGLLNKSMIRVEQPDMELAEAEEDTALLDAVADAAQAADQSATDGMDTAQPSQAKKTQIRLTFEQYKHISNLLVLRVRQNEELIEDDVSLEDTGLRQTKLVEWYLEQIEGEIETEEELLERKRVVDAVIHRLIFTDNVLIELTDKKDTTEDHDPVLVVHPNYVMEDD